MKTVKRIIEKFKVIKHIITDDEYAVYTITVKDGKSIKKKCCCYISCNSSYAFLSSIIDYTKKMIPYENYKNKYNFMKWRDKDERTVLF